MKNSGVCPKCQSKDILYVPPATLGSGWQINIQVGVFSMAKIARYICTQCGYVEQWIESPTDIKKLRKYYG